MTVETETGTATLWYHPVAYLPGYGHNALRVAGGAVQVPSGTTFTVGMCATACPEALAAAGRGTLRAGEFDSSTNDCFCSDAFPPFEKFASDIVTNVGDTTLDLNRGRQPPVFLAQQCAHVVRDLTGARYVWTKDAPARTAAWCAGAAPQHAGGVRLLNASVLTSATRAAARATARSCAPTRLRPPSHDPRPRRRGRRHSGAAVPAGAVTAARRRRRSPPLPPGAPRPRRLARVDAGPGEVPFRIEYDNDYALTCDVPDAACGEALIRHPAQRRPRRHLPRRRRARCARRRLAAVPLRVHAATATPPASNGELTNAFYAGEGLFGLRFPGREAADGQGFSLFWRPRRRRRGGERYAAPAPSPPRAARRC